jgi:hypothetical protein
MCYFITVGIAREKTGLLLDRRNRGIHIAPQSNAHIARRLPKEYATFVVTSDGCSCGLYDGDADTDEPGQGVSFDRLRKKYQRKGWSQAKIDRAISDAERCLRPDAVRAGLRPDIRNLLADIAEQCGELAIVIHFYHGHITTEKLTLAASVTISPSDLRAGTTPILEDTIVWIGRPKPRQSLR